jgi:hypothetical protein
MDTLEELGKGSNGKGFFKHVFNFNNDSKVEMINIIQYAVLAIVPIVFLNKMMQKYVPEADEDKGSPEILAEILTQVIVMFLGILLVHRIITYVPTYSGEKYEDFNVTSIILAVLIIVLSLQTKLGEKVSILVDRLLELWNGTPVKVNGKSNGSVKVSQPISQMPQMMQMPQMPQMQQTQSMGTTSISDLPQVQQPNYDAMYRQDTTPLVDAATPGLEGFGEPMAANSALGGGAFGTW